MHDDSLDDDDDCGVGDSELEELPIGVLANFPEAEDDDKDTRLLEGRVSDDEDETPTRGGPNTPGFVSGALLHITKGVFKVCDSDTNWNNVRRSIRFRFQAAFKSCTNKPANNAPFTSSCSTGSGCAPTVIFIEGTCAHTYLSHSFSGSAI
jgi:hypothetical protein